MQELITKIIIIEYNIKILEIIINHIICIVGMDKRVFNDKKSINFEDSYLAYAAGFLGNYNKQLILLT